MNPDAVSHPNIDTGIGIVDVPPSGIDEPHGESSNVIFGNRN
jgi:hypothetical protein